MGKGSKSPNTKVVKKRPSPVTQKISGGGSRDRDKESRDKCDFSFETTLLISTPLPYPVSVGDQATLIPNSNEPSEIEIWIGPNKLTSYQGLYQKRLLSCMGAGYTYEGKVASVRQRKSDTEIQLSLSGRLR